MRAHRGAGRLAGPGGDRGVRPTEGRRWVLALYRSQHFLLPQGRTLLSHRRLVVGFRVVERFWRKLGGGAAWDGLSAG